MEEEIWKRLPIELYFVIKKLYLKKVEGSFRYHLAYKSGRRQFATIKGQWDPLLTGCYNIDYWREFYDTFSIKEIMIRGLGH
jgi:hypothetical protein